MINFPAINWLTGKGYPLSKGGDNQFYWDEESNNIYLFKEGFWNLIGNFNEMSGNEDASQCFEELLSNVRVWGLNLTTSSFPLSVIFLDSTIPYQPGLGLVILTSSSSSGTFTASQNIITGSFTDPTLATFSGGFLPNSRYKATSEIKFMVKSGAPRINIGLIISSASVAERNDPYFNNRACFGLSINSQSSLGNISFTERLSSFLNGSNNLTVIKPIINETWMTVRIEVISFKKEIILKCYLDNELIKTSRIISNGTNQIMQMNFSGIATDISDIIAIDNSKNKLERLK